MPRASQVALVGKNPPDNAGDTDLIPGWGTSPGEGNGNPLQYSCLENSMDREAWRATVHGVTKRVRHDWAPEHIMCQTPCWALDVQIQVIQDPCCRRVYSLVKEIVVVRLLGCIYDPIDCSTVGFPVFHCLLKFAQTHVYWVGDAIQTSHPLSPPSPPALSLSQYQGLFQGMGSSYQVAKVMSLFFNMLSRCAIAFQGVGIFSFRGCSHHLQWFGGPRK